MGTKTLAASIAENRRKEWPLQTETVTTVTERLEEKIKICKSTLEGKDVVRRDYWTGQLEALQYALVIVKRITCGI